MANVFQNIRINLALIGELTKEKYDKLPYYIQMDDRVIEKVLQSDGSTIELIPNEEKRMEYALKTPSLLPFIGRWEQETIIKENPELLSYLTDSDTITSLVIREQMPITRETFLKLTLDDKKSITMDYGYYTCLPYLTNEEQIQFLRYEGNPNTKSREDDYKNILKYLNEDVIISIVEDDIKNDIISTRKGREYKRIPEKFNIYILNDNLQLTIANKDKEYLKYVKGEVQQAYIGDNFELIKYASPETQLILCSRNIANIRYTSEDIQAKFIRRDPKLIEYCSESTMRTALYYPEKYNFTANAQMMKKLILTDLYMRKDKNIHEIVQDNEEQLKLAKWNNNVVKLFSKSHPSRREFVRDLLLANLNKFNGTENLVDTVKNVNVNEYMPFFDPDGSNRYPNDDLSKLEGISKVLLNDSILLRTPEQMLIDYTNEPSRDKLIEIIRTTYGNESAKILEDRPRIDIPNLPSLTIFDEKLIENFGVGFVHSLITYNYKALPVINDILEDSEVMQTFKYYYSTLVEINGTNPATIDKALSNFYDYGKVFDSIKGKELTDKQKGNLELLVLEDKNIFNITNIDQLESYDVVRRNHYEDLINKATDTAEIKKTLYNEHSYEDLAKQRDDIIEIKNLFFKAYFGIEFKSDRGSYTPETISASEVIDYYNINKILSDEKAIESGMFNQDDIDSLELLSIISSIQDIDVLKELYSDLGKVSDIVNPTDVNQIKVKCPMFFAQQLADSLITHKKVEEMLLENADGISKRIENDVEIVTFEGVRFKALVSTIGTTNSKINGTYSYDEYKDWIEFENGVSTISGSLYSDEILDGYESSWRKEKINFGFEVKPEQILGMGATDIHTSHGLKLPYTEFNFGKTKFDYPESLLEETAKMRDPSHPYNEVAFTRFEADPDKIQEGTYGGRIMPSYIYRVGKAKEIDLEIAKKFGIPVYEVNPEFYNKHNFNIPQQTDYEKQDSKWLKGVKAKYGGIDHESR